MCQYYVWSSLFWCNFSLLLTVLIFRFRTSNVLVPSSLSLSLCLICFSYLSMAIAVGAHMYTTFAWFYLNIQHFCSFIFCQNFCKPHTHRRWLSFLITSIHFLLFISSSSFPFAFHFHMVKRKCSILLVVQLFAADRIQLACCCCHIVIAITFLGCFTCRFYIYLRFVYSQLHCYFSHKISSFFGQFLYELSAFRSRPLSYSIDAYIF